MERKHKEKKVLSSVYVASVSGGKDSVYMLLFILSHLDLYPLDCVVFVNTGMEFEAVYAVLEQIKELLKERGIPFYEIDISGEFIFKMFDKEVCKQGTDEVHRIGYGWCGGVCRWGTSCKFQALNRFYKEKFPDCFIYEYVGIAADEPDRADYCSAGSRCKVYPLYNHGITEAMCLRGCYDAGYVWVEDGVPLYAILDRLSCWCCRNKNLKELKEIFYRLPNYWKRLKELEVKIGEPMKGDVSLKALEKRFIKEGYAISLFDLAGYPFL